MSVYKTITDDTLYETASHGNNRYPFAYYPEDIWQFDLHRIDWHWHHEFEFLFSTENTVICIIGTNRIELQKGHGIFINSSILHRYEAYSNAYAPNIVFSPCLLAAENSIIYEKYVAPIINSSISYQVFKPQISWQNQILQTLCEIFSIQKNLLHSELRTLQKLIQIWDILLSHLDNAINSSGVFKLNHKQAKLHTMIQYIHDHYAEEITLDMIASSASLSKSGALNIFQSGICTSPVAYLIQYRLSQAAKQLYTTQKPVAVIAAQTGFANTGYFCRKFKQYYHMSATEYWQQIIQRED